jgi:hypothetical protein
LFDSGVQLFTLQIFSDQTLLLRLAGPVLLEEREGKYQKVIETDEIGSDDLNNLLMY